MALIQGPSGDEMIVNAQGQAWVTTSNKNRIGTYIGHSGLLNAQASAHNATTGFLWLLNPSTSARTVALRRMEVSSTALGVAAVATRLTLERISFTGSPGATPISPAKVESSYPTAAAVFTTSSGGFSPAVGPVLFGFQLTTVLTAVATVVPVLLEYVPSSEFGYPVLAPGEGLVLRQADAGVASDPRRITVNVAWEEY